MSYEPYSKNLSYDTTTEDLEPYRAQVKRAFIYLIVAGVLNVAIGIGVIWLTSNHDGDGELASVGIGAVICGVVFGVCAWVYRSQRAAWALIPPLVLAALNIVGVFLLLVASGGRPVASGLIISILLIRHLIPGYKAMKRLQEAGE